MSRPTKFYSTWTRGTCQAKCGRSDQPVSLTHVPGFVICAECLREIREIDMTANDLSMIRREMRAYGIPLNIRDLAA